MIRKMDEVLFLCKVKNIAGSTKEVNATEQHVRWLVGRPIRPDILKAIINLNVDPDGQEDTCTYDELLRKTELDKCNVTEWVLTTDEKVEKFKSEKTNALCTEYKSSATLLDDMDQI